MLLKCLDQNSLDVIVTPRYLTEETTGMGLLSTLYPLHPTSEPLYPPHPTPVPLASSPYLCALISSPYFCAPLPSSPYFCAPLPSSPYLCALYLPHPTSVPFLCTSETVKERTTNSGNSFSFSSLTTTPPYWIEPCLGQYRLHFICWRKTRANLRASRFYSSVALDVACSM